MLSLENASHELGITRQTLARYEADSSEASAGFLADAASFYACPIQCIHIGRADFFAQELLRARFEATC